MSISSQSHGVNHRSLECGRFEGLEPLERRSLLSAGSLNIHFGTHGTATIPDPNANLAIIAQAPAPDGGILIAGTDGNVLSGDGWIIELTPSGKLDGHFGAGGIVTINNPRDASTNQMTGMTVLTDGDVIIVTTDGNLRAYTSKGKVDK